MTDGRLKQNPCRYCVRAFVWKNKHIPNLSPECYKCENRLAHEAYLKEQRKYEDGEYIGSLEELLRQEYVMLHHRIKHIEVIRSAPLRVVEGWIKHGILRKAVLKKGDK